MSHRPSLAPVRPRYKLGPTTYFARFLLCDEINHPTRNTVGDTEVEGLMNQQMVIYKSLVIIENYGPNRCSDAIGGVLPVVTY